MVIAMDSRSKTPAMLPKKCTAALQNGRVKARTISATEADAIKTKAIEAPLNACGSVNQVLV